MRFPTNWHLSVERAKAVGALLKKGLAQPDRVQVDGKGAEVRSRPNATADGRAKNRRVEILIPRIGLNGSGRNVAHRSSSSDLSKKLIRLALWGAGLASISAMIWTLGPLVAIGDYRPLENYLIRDAVILIIMAAAATGAGLQFYRRKTSSAQLAEGIGAAADDRERRGRAARQDEGRARDAEEGGRRKGRLSLRPALVSC